MIMSGIKDLASSSNIFFSLFFFLMIRRPPRSTLFPYTTPSDLLLHLAGHPEAQVRFDARSHRSDETAVGRLALVMDHGHQDRPLWRRRLGRDLVARRQGAQGERQGHEFHGETSRTEHGGTSLMIIDEK